jgi:hypothetical protein
VHQRCAWQYSTVGGILQALGSWTGLRLRTGRLQVQILPRALKPACLRVGLSFAGSGIGLIQPRREGGTRPHRQRDAIGLEAKPADPRRRPDQARLLAGCVEGWALLVSRLSLGVWSLVSGTVVGMAAEEAAAVGQDLFRGLSGERCGLCARPGVLKGDVRAVDGQQVVGAAEVLRQQHDVPALAAEDVDLLARRLPEAGPVGVGEGALL